MGMAVMVGRALGVERLRHPLAGAWWWRLATYLRRRGPLAPRHLATLSGRFADDDATASLPGAHHAPPAAPTTAPANDQYFGDLFLQHRLPLLEYICGMTRDREWAADLVQDTFVRAYAARQTLATVTQPRAWLYRIATHLTLNALRHQHHFTWLPLGRIEPEAGPDDSASRAIRPALPPLALPAEDVAITITERDAVWSVLAALPPRWRAVLLLQTTGGFAVDDIAALLHLSAPNVRKILFRAKERFRETYTRLNTQATPQEVARDATQEGGVA